MPLLANQDLGVLGQIDITYTTLDSSDTFVYTVGAGKQVLLLRNPTGGVIAGTFIGDAAPSNANCPGIGVVTVDAEAFSLAASGDAAFALNGIPTKLKGTTTITGGSGLEAALVTT